MDAYGNAQSFGVSSITYTPVVAGLPYTTFALHAASGLGGPSDQNFARLVYSTASTNSDCEDPAFIVPADSPFDGVTSAACTAAICTGSLVQYADARFPFEGQFTICYSRDAVSWERVGYDLFVFGASTGRGSKFWCSVNTIDCEVKLGGSALTVAKPILPLPYGSGCGIASGSTTHFEPLPGRLYSNVGMQGVFSVHNFGEFLDNPNPATLILCFCPGFDATGDGECNSDDDFVQPAGSLYVTAAETPVNSYPLISFSVRIRCGGSQAKDAAAATSGASIVRGAADP